MLLGRLAVASAYQGKGLGGVLLVAMLVDAKDEIARLFYERYGFTLLPGETRRFYLPIDAALKYDLYLPSRHI